MAANLQAAFAVGARAGTRSVQLLTAVWRELARQDGDVV